VQYRGEIFAGEQPAILDRKLFEAIQTKLDQQRISQNNARHESGALLMMKFSVHTGHWYVDLIRFLAARRRLDVSRLSSS
jgi:site-specific DNA recombinase